MGIREYIYNNFKGTDENEIYKSIEDSITSQDEVILPGLGVMFEIFWKSNIIDKKYITNIIYNNINKK